MVGGFLAQVVEPRPEVGAIGQGKDVQERQPVRVDAVSWSSRRRRSVVTTSIRTGSCCSSGRCSLPPWTAARRAPASRTRSATSCGSPRRHRLPRQRGRDVRGRGAVDVRHGAPMANLAGSRSPRPTRLTASALEPVRGNRSGERSRWCASSPASMNSLRPCPGVAYHAAEQGPR